MKDITFLILLLLLGNIISLCVIFLPVATVTVVPNTPEWQEKIASREDLFISREGGYEIAMGDKDTPKEKFYKVLLLNIIILISGVIAIKVDRKNENINN